MKEYIKKKAEDNRINICEMIAADAEKDATEFDGKLFKANRKYKRAWQQTMIVAMQMETKNNITK